jgi:hypothetical protein
MISMYACTTWIMMTVQQQLDRVGARQYIKIVVYYSVFLNGIKWNIL